MNETNDIYEFELEDGTKNSTENLDQLILIPEHLQKNKEKTIDFYLRILPGCEVIGETNLPKYIIEKKNAESFFENLKVVGGRNYRYEIIDSEGNVKSPYSLSPFSKNLMLEEIGEVRHGTKRSKIYKLINKEGITSFKNYYTIGPLKDGLARVKSNQEYGYIDEYGNEVIPCQYEEAYDFSDGLARVKRKNSSIYIYINKNNQCAFQSAYEEAYDFKDGLACVRSSYSKLYGCIDSNGKRVIPCIYDMPIEFFSGLAYVRNKNGFFLINKNNEILFKCKQYDELSQFSEGLVRVLSCNYFDIFKDGRRYKYTDSYKPQYYGFINESGDEVVKCEYLKASDFKDGAVIVNNNCLINSKGELISKTYDKIFDIKNGIAIVKKDGLYGCIDCTGKELIPCLYDRLINTTSGVFWGEINSSWNMIKMDAISQKTIVKKVDFNELQSEQVSLFWQFLSSLLSTDSMESLSKDLKLIELLTKQFSEFYMFDLSTGKASKIKNLKKILTKEETSTDLNSDKGKTFQKVKKFN